MRTISLKECDGLPVGLLMDLEDGTFEILREFELGPMTGRVRLAMSDPKLSSNTGRQNTALLTHLATRIGSFNPPDETTLRMLTFVDREFLSWIITLRRLGDEPIEIEIVCEKCSESLLQEIHPDQLLVNILEEEDYEIIEDPTFKPNKKKRLRKHIRTFFFSDSVLGREMRVRMLTGKDEERFAPLQLKNAEEAQYRTMHAAIVTYGGEPLVYEEFLDLPENQLEWIQACMTSLDIGASQRVRVKCGSCSQEVVATLNPLDLFSDSDPLKVSPPYEIKSSPSD